MQQNAGKRVDGMGRVPQQSGIGQESPSRRGKGRAYRKWGIVAIVVVLVIAVGATCMWWLHRNTQQIDTSRYQVVFMQSGQVFFGKLENTSGEYLTLTNAYYAQSNGTAATDGKAQPSAQTQIVPINKEVYSPDSSVALRSDQVLFWQNLSKDSQVTKLIDSQKK